MISKVYLHADEQTRTQQHILCLLGIILPPVPIFILTAPKYTVRTKEFWINILLCIVFYFGAIIHTVWFVYIGFPKGRLNGYERLENDLEARDHSQDSEHLGQQRQQLEHQSRQHRQQQEHQRAQQEQQKKHQQENQLKQKNEQALNRQELGEGQGSSHLEVEPPTYEEVAGSSQGNAKDNMQLGDNKVQT